MGFNLIQYRSELRLDLKDSGALWSNGELDRCVQRAVDDLSRFLPLEKVHDVTFSYDVDEEPITSPADTSLTAIVAAQSIDVAAGGLLTIAGQPDVPRPLRITITDADDSTYQAGFVIRGTDKDNIFQSESFNYSRGTSKTLNGTKEFKTVYEVELDSDYGSHAGDTASVGYGTYTGAFVYLANRPIRPESEAVTTSPAGTTYARGTDYSMDYANGAIKLIGMAAATAYLVSYDKSRLGINISSILPEITRIQRVQYPADQTPQQFVSYNIIGDFMFIGSQKTGESQTSLIADKHIHIYYECKHSPPGECGIGSFPSFLDEVICVGAGAYALLMKAYQYEHQAVTDAASARTALGYLADIHILCDDALDKIATYMETNGTTDNAVDVLSNITDDIGELRTAITGALEAADNYLDEVDTTDLTGAEGVWTSEALLITAADGNLTTGIATINKVNVGSDVPELYRRYADTELAQAQLWDAKRKDFLQEATARTNAAMMFIQMVAQRLSNLRSYIDESEGWVRIAETFMAEAQGRIAEMDRHLAETTQYTYLIDRDLTLADRWRAEGLEKRNEFWSVLRDKSEYRKRTSSTPVKQPA